MISATTQARREAYFRLERQLADERTHLMAEGTPFLLPAVIDATPERGALVPKSFLAVQWTRIRSPDSLDAFGERAKKLMRGSDVARVSRPVRAKPMGQSGRSPTGPGESGSFFTTDHPDSPARGG
ncbi:MAG: hypothetical protein HZA93_24785 [Verrucomicrobia bacterium]|nr:hypothetical protein [Verrucomicrobiota bacterium]